MQTFQNAFSVARSFHFNLFWTSQVSLPPSFPLRPRLRSFTSPRSLIFPPFTRRVLLFRLSPSARSVPRSTLSPIHHRQQSDSPINDVTWNLYLRPALSRWHDLNYWFLKTEKCSDVLILCLSFSGAPTRHLYIKTQLFYLQLVSFKNW